MELTREQLKLAAARAENTVATYRSAWKDFTKWAESNHRNALPADSETLCLYITQVLNRPSKVTTAIGRVIAINAYHRDAGLSIPPGEEVWELIRGARKVRAEWPIGKTALSVGQLRDIALHFDGTRIIEVRNRAILLLGYATALRRSNIVGLQLSDIAFHPQGACVRVRREKQDQSGKGRTIGIPYAVRPELCAVNSLQDWIGLRGSFEGALFTHIEKSGRITLEPLGGYMVSRIVKYCLIDCGIDPAAYAAHSLRAGFITEALSRGVSDVVVAAHTGHRSLQVLRKYFRPSPFQGNVCHLIGL